MYSSRIDLGETRIRLTTDVYGHGLEGFISGIRRDLKSHILRNPDFSVSLEPLEMSDGELPDIVLRMHESSRLASVGPMACVAGTISELSLNHLISNGSRHSVVENGGDIAMVNDRKVLCGIYSGNEVLGNDIAFEIRARKRPLGICTSSARIGHSISFGDADSVTVIANSASLCDGLATRIANGAVGDDDEDRASNALECAESYRELFDGTLIVCGDNVATVGRLPRIVETKDFDANILPK